MKSSEATRRPGDVAELRGMFASRTLRLTKQLEQVARKALARPELVAFGSARSVATACSVSPTTVTRLATALGFESFRDFKTFFQQHLRKMSHS
ncbi:MULTISPECIES: MurR/RpiR family transcriptional regulator [Sinorhizobium/Ensifer group]|jgi:DNA-binding MurR/RpiR family transcriptional regulator|uniref:MurR/RpiR family transcriptional regulator n=1 Tax=Sinorhizobium/Ensifer group TaxID=227292 RepID=UPI00071C8AC7|nr:MurR/RpiR family transcriptional regulator [Sinorhizobium sp. Sb3]